MTQANAAAWSRALSLSAMSSTQTPRTPASLRSMPRPASCCGSFKPLIGGEATARGVSYWTDGSDSRIFAGYRYYLYAIDAKTGKLISSFGENGRIDLRKGLRDPYERQSTGLTSPGSSTRT